MDEALALCPYGCGRMLPVEVDDDEFSTATCPEHGEVEWDYDASWVVAYVDGRPMFQHP